MSKLRAMQQPLDIMPVSAESAVVFATRVRFPTRAIFEVLDKDCDKQSQNSFVEAVTAQR